MIERIRITNYKRCRQFDLHCNGRLNLLVGDNEAGKSTILEAINLVLTRRLNGRMVDSELTPHLFNSDTVREYLDSLTKQGAKLPPPTIVIEAYLNMTPETADLRGTMNDARDDAVGLRLEIGLNEEHRKEYEKLLELPERIQAVPVEFYRVSWMDFAGNTVTRNTAVRAFFVDATTIRMQSGTDYYLSAIINDGLDAQERAGLALAYRGLKEAFAKQSAISGINDKLGLKKGILSAKEVTVAMDVSSRGSWETSLTPHLGNIPYSQAGKGEQNALKIMFALDARAGSAAVILIEEPENHLSYSSLTILLHQIAEKCKEKHLFVATHSAYVLNKLGLSNVVMLHGESAAFLTDLSADTQEYFQRLSGYDTLRLILAKRAILVEGPSDELVVTKAYQLRHHKLPADSGVDIINVRGISFPRFLDIATLLNIRVDVVADNDGRYDDRITKRFSSYGKVPSIHIHASDDNSLPSLEEQIGSANELATLNALCNRDFTSLKDALKYMKDNKTEWALRYLTTEVDVKVPDYINDAVS